MATFPTSISPSSVRVMRTSAVAVTESSFSFKQQVQAHTGKRYSIEVSYPPMTEAQAAVFQQFFYDLNGREGTFTLNLTTYAQGITPAPGVLTFRMRDNVLGWDIKGKRIYGFSFVADQVV